MLSFRGRRDVDKGAKQAEVQSRSGIEANAAQGDIREVR